MPNQSKNMDYIEIRNKMPFTFIVKATLSKKQKRITNLYLNRSVQLLSFLISTIVLSSIIIDILLISTSQTLSIHLLLYLNCLVLIHTLINIISKHFTPSEMWGISSSLIGIAKNKTGVKEFKHDFKQSIQKKEKNDRTRLFLLIFQLIIVVLFILAVPIDSSPLSLFIGLFFIGDALYEFWLTMVFKSFPIYLEVYEKDASTPQISPILN